MCYEKDIKKFIQDNKRGENIPDDTPEDYASSDEDEGDDESDSSVTSFDEGQPQKVKKIMSKRKASARCGWQSHDLALFTHHHLHHKLPLCHLISPTHGLFAR